MKKRLSQYIVHMLTKIFIFITYQNISKLKLFSLVNQLNGFNYKYQGDFTDLIILLNNVCLFQEVINKAKKNKEAQYGYII